MNREVSGVSVSVNLDIQRSFVMGPVRQSHRSDLTGRYAVQCRTGCPSCLILIRLQPSGRHKRLYGSDTI